MMRSMAGVFSCLIVSFSLADQPVKKSGSTEERPTSEELHAAISKSLTLLEMTSAATADQRRCFTCHGQALPMMTFAEARRFGFDIDQQNFDRQLDHTHAHLRRGKENYLQGKGQGGKVDTAGYALWTLEAGQRAPDEVTAAVVGYLLSAQSDQGHWKCTSDRPPSETSDFTTTYLALRALGVFSDETQGAEVQRARRSASDWLSKERPATTEDHVFQLRSVYLTDPGSDFLFKLAEKLWQIQQDDGGWAQKPEMESDAYATATALVALARVDADWVHDSRYASGLRFLLKSQESDGSWLVESRSKPFQVHFESGFPHDKDQFISTNASAWATIAMLLALPVEHEKPNAKRSESTDHTN